MFGIADNGVVKAEDMPVVKTDLETNTNLILPVLSLLLEWLYEVSGDHG